MTNVIGIDLGTTNSSVASIVEDEARVFENALGNKLTPSVVAYTRYGEILVGEQAKRQALENPTGTFFSLKVLLGRKYVDSEIQRLNELVPYKIVEGPNGDAWLEAHGKQFAPAQLLAEILRDLKITAETRLKTNVSQAVITAPANFNDLQRQGINDAARIAGLEVVRIISEPTAAALAYGFGRSRRPNTIAVYDLGGGSFDISILEIGDGVFEVKSTSGITFLGGQDFDMRLIRHLVQAFRNEHNVDLASEPVALQRLKEAAENAKIELSSMAQTIIHLPFLTTHLATGSALHLNKRLTRNEFEGLVGRLIATTIRPCRHALHLAGLRPAQIEDIVLVGGMTRMPKVRDVVKQEFGKEPNQRVNPDEAVALGAAIQAAILAGRIKEVLLLDVTPLSLGIETFGDVFTRVIERNTTIPTKKCIAVSTAEDNQNQVNIRVFQGESGIASRNALVGEFALEGIAPSRRGVPQIEVTFDIDANGIIQVSAKDKATDKEQAIRVKTSSGLDEAAIERMIQEGVRPKHDGADASSPFDSGNVSEEELANEHSVVGRQSKTRTATVKEKSEAKTSTKRTTRRSRKARLPGS